MGAKKKVALSDAEKLEAACKELGWHFDTLEDVPVDIQESVAEWAEQYDEVMEDLRLADSNAANLLLDLCRAVAASGLVQGGCVGCQDEEQFDGVLTNIVYAKLFIQFGYAKNCFAELCSTPFSDAEDYIERHEKVCGLISEHFADYL